VHRYVDDFLARHSLGEVLPDPAEAVQDTPTDETGNQEMEPL
jgi:hypothetical protein